MLIENVRKLNPLSRLVYWIKEREKIRKKKEARFILPWTDDEILATYRFCNVRREYDKVTVWVTKNWRSKHDSCDDLWFAMVVARLFNLPSTLAVIKFPVPFDQEEITKKLKDWRDAGNKLFNGAYIVSTNGFSMDKVDYLMERVLAPLWKDRRELRPHTFEKLAHYHKALLEYDGLGSFMAAQVIADVKYQHRMLHIADWHTFAASGPGSRRGLNRVLDRPVDQRWNEQEWYAELIKLRKAVDYRVSLNLHAQDLQNCLCEFDKYTRVLQGEGKPKQKYKPQIGK